MMGSGWCQEFWHLGVVGTLVSHLHGSIIISYLYHDSQSCREGRVVKVLLAKVLMVGMLIVVVAMIVVEVLMAKVILDVEMFVVEDMVKEHTV